MNRADRRDLYRLLGGLLQQPPSETFLSTVASLGTLRRLSGRTRDAVVRDALRRMDDDLARGPVALVEIAQDYAALFDRPVRPLAPPYEGAYRSRADVASIVRDAYAARGIAFEGVGERAADHVGFELEFVSILLAQGTRSRTARRVRREFLSEHVLRWLPAWAADVCEHSRGVFMHGVGDVVAGLCAAEQLRSTSSRRWAAEPLPIVTAA